MQYFSKYRNCQKYYNLYNYKTNNNEYMKFYIRYTVNGCLYKYILDGVFYHDTKPAITSYFEENIITNLSYYKNGKKHHKSNGPAVIYNDRNDNYIQHLYYNNDICINTVDKSVYVYVYDK